MGVVGAEGLRFQAFSETVLRFLALKIQLNGSFLSERFEEFFDKQCSRSQIIYHEIGAKGPVIINGGGWGGRY